MSEKFENLINAVVKKEKYATTNFLKHIPKITSELSQVDHVELINFILGWCDIEIPQNLVLIVDCFNVLLPPDANNFVFFSFLSLFSEIIDTAYSFVEEQILYFTSYLVKNFGETYLPEAGFNFFMNTLGLSELPNTVALVIKILARILSVVDHDGKEEYFEMLKKKVRKQKTVCVKIAIIDSVPFLLESVEPSNLYLIVVVPILLTPSSEQIPIIGVQNLKASLPRLTFSELLFPNTINPQPPITNLS